MKVRIVAAATTLLAAAPAFAQSPTAPRREAYTLTLTPQEVQAVASGLGKLPLEVALPAFEKIRAQVAEQDRKAAESEAPASAPPKP
ncbi:hypothetical protein SAMN04487843_108197 [Methylobacterium sp. ap11]|uniref:hypothetical protein n=1 Tax=Methylobacterium sp. ap11 TaxID=1761799 RepID=UPI0008D09F44|nr:hypothetical protein [Methylobacterium sp. ap11]SEP21256.1 hypothetical protein SAMN04487843_108197 [Methylobacterium sp. ap11]